MSGKVRIGNMDTNYEAKVNANGALEIASQPGVLVGDLTAGALNADLVPLTDVSMYKSAVLQVMGTWLGTITIQCSMDNVNFFATTGFYMNSPSSVPTTVTSSNNVLLIPLGFKYLRVRMTSYTSGTATGVIMYSTNTLAFTSGSVNINSLPMPTEHTLTSAATTNATSVKASAGTIYSITVSNTNAAARYLKLYNKASAPTVGTDVPVLTIPIAASGAQVFDLGPLGHRLGTGIAIAITTNAADSDTTAIGAGEVKTMISYV